MFVRSLSFINEECYFLKLEIQKSIDLMHRMATKIITQNDMPIGPEGCVQEFFEVFCHLNNLIFTFRPSLSNANLLSVSCFLISLMTASRISSGQLRGQSTYAPKIVLKTGLLTYDCSLVIV